MWPAAAQMSGPVRSRTTLSLVGMSQMLNRSGWLEFSRTAFKLRFLYPPVTPGGRPVEITEERHDGAHRVHLTAREGGEIYLEFLRLPDLQPPDEYARHRAYLVGRFGPEAVSQLTETSLQGWPGPTRSAGTGSNERCCRCRWAATPTGSSPTPELG
jgi:hypothetical protein